MELLVLYAQIIFGNDNDNLKTCLSMISLIFTEPTLHIVRHPSLPLTLSQLLWGNFFFSREGNFFGRLCVQYSTPSLYQLFKDFWGKYSCSFQYNPQEQLWSWNWKINLNHLSLIAKKTVCRGFQEHKNTFYQYFLTEDEFSKTYFISNSK